MTTIPDPMGGGLLVGASAAFHAALGKKNEWEKVYIRYLPKLFSKLCSKMCSKPTKCVVNAVYIEARVTA